MRMMFPKMHAIVIRVSLSISIYLAIIVSSEDVAHAI